jgi:hypothetical protein
MGNAAQISKEHLKNAVEAARRRDVRGYFIAIAESHVLDGLVHRLHARWSRIEYGVVEATIAQAAEAMYNAIANEQRVVSNPGGYLYGTANKMLVTGHGAGVLRVKPISEGFDVIDPATELKSSSNLPPREHLVAEALRRARALVPRLGQENVIKVMTFIFDAIERGEHHIDNEYIGEALALSPDTVRQSKSRGFRRLEAEARKEGFEIPDFADEDAVEAIGQE